MTRKIPFNQFGSLETADDIFNYLDGRAYSHGGYYHYTSLSTIDSIIKNKEFWISCVSGFNDKADQRQFEDDKKLFYSLCFSTGVNENLPLWYLYSGLNGKGGRIRFTMNKVKILIEKGTYQLCEIIRDKERKIKEIEPKLLLAKDENMLVEFKDVLYCRKDEKEIGIKYNNMTNYKLSLEEYEKLHKQHTHFIKGLIWFYEKETRHSIKFCVKAKPTSQEQGLRSKHDLGFPLNCHTPAG